jgi:hypothetical protein
MKWTVLFSILFASSVWSNESPPELWSWIKDLKKSKEACEIQSSYALQSLSLENRVENQFGIYGTVRSSRVVVKCIAISASESKLLVAVAGHDRDAVELVRNEIVQSIQ